MKIYKKLKGMNKRTKVGLVGTALYAATLASPLYAAVKNEKVAEPINLEQVITVEQANTLYKEKLTEYSSDKIMEFQELKNLYEINEINLKLLEEEKVAVVEEYDASTAEIDPIDSEIKKHQGSLNNTEEIAVLADIRKKLDENVLGYYSGLLDEDNVNITYSAETLLDKTVNVSFRNIIVELDQLLRQYYNDDYFAPLLNKKHYTLNDILTVYNRIHNKEDYVNAAQQEELTNAISVLEKRKLAILNSDRVKSLEKKIEDIGSDINVVSNTINYFEAYLHQKNEVDASETSNRNLNKEINLAALKYDLLKQNGIDDLFSTTKHFEQDISSSISDLKKYFGSEGLEVEIENIKNPAKTLVHPALGFTIALFLPMVRNLLLKRYIRGKDADGIEYFLSSCAGLSNSGLAMILMDGVHPLLFPARIIIPPLLFQPLFKVLKTDPCRWFH